MPLTPDPIHFVSQGTGQPAILVHGVAASSAGWGGLMPALAGAGFSAYAPDLPGHGESQKPRHPDHYHVQKIFAALEAWIERLDISGPLVLIGHSLGGYLSLRYSLAHPEQVRAMVLIDPFYSPAQLTPAVHWLARRPAVGVQALREVSESLIRATTYLDIPFSGNFPPAARRQIARDLKRAAPEILHVLPTVEDLTPQLSRIQTPTMVIFGNRDMTLRPSTFPRLAKELPVASLYKIKGAGHQPHLTKSMMVNQLILNFLG